MANRNKYESQRLDVSDYSSEEEWQAPFKFTPTKNLKTRKIEKDRFYGVESNQEESSSVAEEEKEPETEFQRYSKFMQATTKPRVLVKTVLKTKDALDLLVKKHGVDIRIAFHALYVMNGNLEWADLYLDEDIPLDELPFLPWTPREDEVILEEEQDENEDYQAIIEKRGKQEALDRFAFLKSRQ